MVRGEELPSSRVGMPSTVDAERSGRLTASLRSLLSGSEKKRDDSVRHSTGSEAVGKATRRQANPLPAASSQLRSVSLRADAGQARAAGLGVAWPAGAADWAGARARGGGANVGGRGGA